MNISMNLSDSQASSKEDVSQTSEEPEPVTSHEKYFVNTGDEI